MIALCLVLPLAAHAFQPAFPVKNKNALASSLPKLDFTVEDFLPTTPKDVFTAAVDDPSASFSKVSAEENTMMDDETESFLLMIEDTPIGKLEEAEIELVKELLSSHEEDQEDEVTLERFLYRLVDEWVKVRTNFARPSEENVLRVMRAWQQRCIGTDASHRNTDVLPTATEHILDIYNMYLSCFGDTSTNIAELALEVLCYRRGVSRQVQKILRDYETPSPKMTEYLIVALARDGKPKAAERILRNERNLNISVDTLNYILTGYAKSSEEMGDIAEQLVIYMTDERNLTPNGSTFTCLMDCYAQEKSWNAASKCQSILDQMIEVEDPNIRPNIVAWTSVMSTWGRLTREGKPDACGKVNELMTRLQEAFDPSEIDAHVYVTWMRANAWSLTETGLKKAEEIMNEMHELYLDGEKDDSFQPNALSIRTVVDAYLQSEVPSKVMEASRIAEQYETYLEVNTKEIYSSVWRMLLFGWTQAGNPVHAETYLERMVEQDLEIDSFCFDKIIETNTQINDATSMQRTVRLFELMENCRVAGRMKPNERVYTSFLRAMTKAKVPQLISKAQALLARMNELKAAGDNRGIEPTLFTYNALLMACAEADDNDKEAALALAIKTFQTLRRNNQVDHVSIGGMLRCGSLMDDEDKRKAWMESTFRLACELGIVNIFVMRDFQRLATIDSWKLFFGDIDEASDDNIPSEWKKNVRRKADAAHGKRQHHRSGGRGSTRNGGFKQSGNNRRR